MKGKKASTSGVNLKDAHRAILLNQKQHFKYVSNVVSSCKYNVFTFMPRFLFEQFRKYANLFFLFISLIQQIPNVSPTGRWATIVPLALILSVSATKELIEDIRRRLADNKVNNSQTLVLRAGKLETVPWRKVVVGDILKVTSEKLFPADLVLFSSSESLGMCYVETANLDGETNLKIRQAIPQTAGLLKVKDLESISGSVECELPNRHMYDFSGNVQFSKKLRHPVGVGQMLLRGAMLRNTKWIFGLVVYTGHESKIMLNASAIPLKRSTLDKATNFQVILLFGLLILLSLTSTIIHGIWISKVADSMWYIGLSKQTALDMFLSFLTFVILYNNLVPVSLIVTIEIVKFLQSWFISWDTDMYHSATDTPALVKTSNLNEELGQVKYIFSDKTGTLTQNVMLFRKASIGGVIYGDDETSNRSGIFSDGSLLKALQKNNAHSSLVEEFCMLLAVCHTIIPEKDDSGKLIYQAASPDEAALVAAVKEFGFVFAARTPTNVTVDINGMKVVFDVLNVLEFNSDRKRMSVIIRNASGDIKLYSKGADTVIFERLAKNQPFADKTLNDLEVFAMEGLRTLCIAKRALNENSYKEWNKMYMNAASEIQNREQKTNEAAELIETDLELLGATAIEDKLQDGVPQCIATLMKADIRMWVLTGDKRETAINIGYSCNLLTPGMPLIVMDTQSLERTHQVLVKHVKNLGEFVGKENDIALIITGQALRFALSADSKRYLFDLARSCRAVICCRVSPLQKAEIVKLVRSFVKNAITLGIGDGANDVGMIQASHVGIGISGLEGLQAVAASDYAIAQFRFLTKLLLVHGSWSYQRLCNVILYSFYKNICLYIVGLYFAMQNVFSGQIFYDRWTLSFYNVFFTSLAPLAMGLFDRSITPSALMRFPALYKESQESTRFNTTVFWLWILDACYHAALIYVITTFLLVNEPSHANGMAGDLEFAGHFVYTYIVVTVTAKGGLHTFACSWPVIVSNVFSVILWMGALVAYGYAWPTLPFGERMVGVGVMIVLSPTFWFGFILLPCSALLADVALMALSRTFCKNLREAVQEQQRKGKDPERLIAEATVQPAISKEKTLDAAPWRK